jgi:hypothetical protein
MMARRCSWMKALNSSNTLPLPLRSPPLRAAVIHNGRGAGAGDRELECDAPPPPRAKACEQRGKSRSGSKVGILRRLPNCLRHDSVCAAIESISFFPPHTEFVLSVCFVLFVWGRRDHLYG